MKSPLIHMHLPLYILSKELLNTMESTSENKSLQDMNEGQMFPGAVNKSPVKIIPATHLEMVRHLDKHSSTKHP